MRVVLGRDDRHHETAYLVETDSARKVVTIESRLEPSGEGGGAMEEVEEIVIRSIEVVR